VTGDASLDHLRGRLTALERRVRAAVATRRASDENPDDRFRGLYVGERDVDRLLRGRDASEGAAADDARAFAREIEAQADVAEARGELLRLRQVQRTFDLAPADLDLLLVALAPDLDMRLEALYGYLNDDVSRRRASIGLALELAGVPLPGAPARARLLPGGPLIDAGLVELDETDRPFLTRGLRVPDRVTMFLLGDDRPDERLLPLIGEAGPASGGDPAALARALGTGSRLAYLREPRDGSAAGLAVAALAALGAPALVLDLRRIAPAEDVEELARVAGREARLRGAGLVAGPTDAIASRPGGVRAFAELGWPTVLHGTGAWDPANSRGVPVLVDVALALPEERAAWWRASLDGEAGDGLDPAAETTQFRLAPQQIARAALAARQQAALRGGPVDGDDLRAGARAQNASGLERSARRVSPAVTFDDLVLSGEELAQLHELAARARHRELVLDEWGLGRRSSRGRGITGLFAGDSGTGKTMSAEVIAADLGLDLYVIDLSTVVDKYIGETEKNLDRVFSEAEGMNAVLLFDEADALFGKRSEISDAKDRYANVEVAYLLQRMELFDGIAILTTNMRANVDEAFTRRLDVVVDFPRPDETDRLRLWQLNLSGPLPRAGDEDLEFLARNFDLAGGNIRNVCLCAAYLAADAGRSVAMGDLIRGVAIEYRKLGRMCTESEFGPYLELAQPEALRAGSVQG
jgi:hypothetical protein